MSTGAETMRERHASARRQLKGEDAALPNSTVTANSAQVNTDASTNPFIEAILAADKGPVSEADREKTVNEFLDRTKNAGPMPFCPFRISDMVLFIVLALGVYFFLLSRYKVDLAPLVWHYVGPHYDHHDDPDYKAPSVDLSMLSGDL